MMAVLKPLQLGCVCGSRFKVRLQLGEGLVRDDGLQVPVNVNPKDAPKLETWAGAHEPHGGIGEVKE